MENISAKLELPFKPYAVTGYHFGQRVRSRVILWARHLGDDILADAGTFVYAIGAGKVVWSEVRPGTKEKRNWGGIVVLEHINKTTGSPFYSLYGHITDIQLQVGQEIQIGQKVGVVARGSTPENGWWLKPHLHFAIYIGPWGNAVLPGYKRFFDSRTKLCFWRNPQEYISTYNAL